MVGIVLTEMGRLEEADKAYGRALAKAPDFLPASKNRAVNSFSRREFRTAALEFEALKRLDPGDFLPRLFLGLLATEDSDIETALDHLLEVNQRSPGNG